VKSKVKCVKVVIQLLINLCKSLWRRISTIWIH